MSDESPRRSFRWQALFQRASEAVFVLDRRRRLRFVNPVWEALTGLSADRARGLLCRRPRPTGPDELPEDQVAHLLTPPPEVLQGQFARARRLFHDRSGRPGHPPATWWDVEFLPYRQGAPGEGHLILGRIVPLPAEAPALAVFLPERLVGLRQRAAGRFTFDLLDSQHAVMHRAGRQVRLAVEVRVPVLFVGEPGVGKETLARLVHYQGRARERAFAALDCRRLPATAVAEVLLGEPGSPVRSGVGTIYLREPDCLPRDLQARLAMGLMGDEPPGVRLLAGCSTAPDELVRQGRMPQELAVVLSALQIEVSPLRQRRDDLPVLVERMLARLESADGRRMPGPSPAAWELLRDHTWPGNLSELFAVLADSRARATGERIELADLPAALRLRSSKDAPPPPAGLPLDQLLEQVERRVIELALRRARGNRTRAAQLLGIHRPRLLRRLETFGLDGLKDEMPDHPG
jgi:hypothetical protein